MKRAMMSLCLGISAGICVFIALNWHFQSPTTGSLGNEIKSNSQIPYYFDRIRKALRNDNPGWAGTEEQIGLMVHVLKDKDLSSLPPGIYEQIQYGLRLSGVELSNLGILKDLPLAVLSLKNTGIERLPRLSKLPLVKIELSNNDNLRDISGLIDNKVLYLTIENNQRLIDFDAVNSLSNLRSIFVIRQAMLQDVAFLRSCGKLHECMLAETGVVDITPLADKPIIGLYLKSSPINSLESIKGLRLKQLILDNIQIENLDFLNVEELERVTIKNMHIADIGALKNAPLKSLDISNTKVNSLFTLSSSSLHNLNLSGTAIYDLAPLRGIDIYFLNLSNTPVSDLTPLVGANINFLYIVDTPAAEVPLPDGLNVAVLRRTASDYHVIDKGKETRGLVLK